MAELTKSNRGILALWNDCKPGKEKQYEHWYQTEHLIERLSIPGFLSGQRYESLQGNPRFFTYYETTSPDVLASEAYLKRVNNPTPQTREIMTGIFINMNRTVCQKVYRLGRMQGAYALTVRFKNSCDEEQLTQIINSIAADISVASAEIWLPSEEKDREISVEERLRGEDGKIAGCLLVETLREVDLIPISGILHQSFGPTASISAYRLLCLLSNERAE